MQRVRRPFPVKRQKCRFPEGRAASVLLQGRGRPCYVGERGGAMMRRVDYNLARMSGMLDLSRDEKAKHFLPR